MRILLTFLQYQTQTELFWGLAGVYINFLAHNSMYLLTSLLCSSN